MAKRAKIGDVLELVVPSGGAIYVHYVGTHPVYGDGIAVCPKLFAAPVTVDEQLFKGSYVLFYPARTAVARGLAKVVAELPSRGLPKRLRRPGVRRGSKVETWIVEDGSSEELRHQLSDEERRLPLAVIWNHEFLVQRVLEGWRPEMEGEGCDE